MLHLALPSGWRMPVAGQCEVCRQWTLDKALCADCRARFAAPRARCRRCGLGVGLAADRCGDCLHEPPPFDRTVCVADYGFPWDRLIAEFKFHARPELAGLLGTSLAAAVRLAPPPLPQLLLPVPLAPARLAQRGYNQAWELTRRLARTLAIPARADLLQRPLEADVQAGLGRAARQRNLRRVFMVDARRRAALGGRRIALVDDVMTTGATAREAATVLLHAGAAAVEVWVVARTPH